MKAEDLQYNMLSVSAGIDSTLKEDRKGDTLIYIFSCCRRFFAGDFGEVPAEDTAANLEELEAGEGRAVARYKKGEKLTEDIYIIAYFSADDPGNVDSNNTLIMYVSEY